MLLLCYRAKLQQEQTKREVIEDRSMEQAKRGAAVNTEIIKANSVLKQQLRVSKLQVKILPILNSAIFLGCEQEGATKSCCGCLTVQGAAYS